MSAGTGFGTWSLASLTSLSLQNGTSLSDDGLAAISQHLSSLRCLNLKGCRGLNDSGLAHLSKLTCMSRLRLQVHAAECGANLSALDSSMAC